MTAPTCQLCQLPIWSDGCRLTVYCASDVADALAECRSRALLIAALTAPVVAAACALMSPDGVYEEAALCDSVTAYRAGMRRLGAI